MTSIPRLHTVTGPPGSSPAQQAVLTLLIGLVAGLLLLARDPGGMALIEDHSVELVPDDARRSWFGSGSVQFADDTLDDGYDGLPAPRSAGADGDRF